MRPALYITTCVLLSAGIILAVLTRAANRPSPPDGKPAATTLDLSAARAWADDDRDGLPNSAELTAHTDRDAFRRWFTRIAEGQFYSTSDAWNTEQRDCAGLVRFSLREALRRHDRPWLRRIGAEYEPHAPDVRRYTLDRAPLGEKLFRTRPGAFAETDLSDDTFADFADARTLKEFNAEFVSRDRRHAQAGDLLFFHQPWGARFPYHVMIFVGAAHVAASGDTRAEDWVVYHTGASPTDAGTIRKVRLATLDLHPEARWRPVASNPRFLGFYRLKILM